MSLDGIEKTNPAVVSRLSRLLSHPLLEQLSVELGLLTHPEHRFKDSLEIIKPLAMELKAGGRKSEKYAKNVEEIQKLVNEMQRVSIEIPTTCKTCYIHHFDKKRIPLLMNVDLHIGRYIVIYVLINIHTDKD
mgnify:CR=1 FL=1